MTAPTDPLRTWVFIDGMNLYNDARRAFHSETDHARFGQVAPHGFASLLVERGQANDGRLRRLEAVRIYRGMPSPKHQPDAYAAFRRQSATWVAAGCDVLARPVRYPANWPQSKAEEKGVDVALAVDLLYHAYRHDYDLAIVASTDTDLVPALEALCHLRRAWGRPNLEVVSFRPGKKRLRVEGNKVFCHWLEEADYLAVQDTTNYRRAKTLQTLTPGASAGGGTAPSTT